MKKIVLSAIALGMVLVSCNKEEITPNENLLNESSNHAPKIEFSQNKISKNELNYSNLIEEVETTSNIYLKENNIDVNQETKLPKWLEVLLSDIIGAGTGAAVVHESGGNQNGVIGGAVSVGVAASVGAAVASIDNNGNSGIVYNYNNNFEGVGIAHYILVDEALNGNADWYQNDIINYGQFADRVFVVLKAQNLNCDNAKTCVSPNLIQNTSELVLNGNNNIHAAVDQMGGSNSVKPILHQYFQTMIRLKNYPSALFVNYSILIEDIIVNSNLTDNDKLFLLINMSTSRIGFQYWKS